MTVFETEYEKKSFAITIVLFILLFLFMLLFIIYPLPGDEIVEQGGGGGGEIAINFGNSATGSGDNYKSTDLDVETAKAKSEKETPQVKEILTQTTKAAPSVASVKNPTKTTTPKITEPVKPKTSKDVNDVLSNMINGLETNVARVFITVDNSNININAISLGINAALSYNKLYNGNICPHNHFSRLCVSHFNGMYFTSY
jgi:hypothetical protein